MKVSHGAGEQITIKRHDSTQDEDFEIKTEKWNPMTFAVYTANLELIKLLIEQTICPIKKLLKVRKIMKLIITFSRFQASLTRRKSTDSFLS